MKLTPSVLNLPRRKNIALILIFYLRWVLNTKERNSLEMSDCTINYVVFIFFGSCEFILLFLVANVMDHLDIIHGIKKIGRVIPSPFVILETLLEANVIEVMQMEDLMEENLNKTMRLWMSRRRTNLGKMVNLGRRVNLKRGGI